MKRSLLIILAMVLTLCLSVSAQLPDENNTGIFVQGYGYVGTGGWTDWEAGFQAGFLQEISEKLTGLINVAYWSTGTTLNDSLGDWENIITIGVFRYEIYEYYGWSFNVDGGGGLNWVDRKADKTETELFGTTYFGTFIKHEWPNVYVGAKAGMLYTPDARITTMITGIEAGFMF